MGIDDHDGDAPAEPYTEPMKTIGLVGTRSPVPPAIPLRVDEPIRPIPSVGGVSSHIGSAIGVPSPAVRFTVIIPRIAMSTTLLGYIKYALTGLMWLAGMLGVSVGNDGALRLPDPGSAWYAYVLVGLIAVARVMVGISQSKAMADAEPTPAE
jgi:hypothetical protein